MVEDLRCPNCGGFVSSKQKNCDFCGGSILVESTRSLPKGSLELQKYINSYNQVSKGDSDEIDFSRALCFLKLKQYKNAVNSFEEVIDRNMFNSDAYFYMSIALLEGKKAFQTRKAIVDKIVSLLETAISISDKGIYRIFLAYVKYDYYKRKFINISPDYHQEINLGEQLGYSEEDFDELWDLLNVSKPKIF